MFGLECRLLIGLTLFFCFWKINFAAQKFDDEYNARCRYSQIPRISGRMADGIAKNSNSTKKQYVVGYSKHIEEVPGLRKFASANQGYYEFVPGSGVEFRSQHNGAIIVKKCCSWDSYFDVDNFNCVKSEKQLSKASVPLYLADGFTNHKNASRYFFVKKFPACRNDTVLSVQITSTLRIDSKGIFVNGIFFSKYCVDEHPDYSNKTVVLTCNDPKKFCHNQTCFRKCCPLGESYGESGRRCQKTNQSFNPEIYDLTTLTIDKFAKVSEFGVYLGDACEARGKYLLEKDEGEESFLGLSGTLYVPMYKKCFSEEEFCMEHVQVGNFSGIGTFLCFAKTSTDFENSQLQFFLLSLGLIISCTFLLLTFLVYLFTPKCQNLYGKTLMCYIACLFTAYLCLAVVELKSMELNKTVCVLMGYSILFSFLAAFFWLSVLSFDIWKTFRVERSLDRAKSKNGKKLMFLWYSLYAWSFPSIITGTCAFVNQMANFPYKFIKPDIGEENCWFSRHTKAIHVFFICPISLIITCNLIFYVQTALKIWKVKTEITKMSKQNHKRFRANKDQFLINGKLFIIMGITWSLEIISFFAPHPIWYITDTANALHGVFIFAIFVLKKKMWQKVSHRIQIPLRRMKNLANSGTADCPATKGVKADSKSSGTGAITTSTDDSK